MAFETFMEQSKPRPRAGRLVALVASGVGHSALLLGLAALVLPPAVKAALPTLVPVSLRLAPSPRPPAPPPASAAPAPEPAARAVAAAPSLPRMPKRRPRPARPEPASAPAPDPAMVTQPPTTAPPAPVESADTIAAAAAAPAAPPAVAAGPPSTAASSPAAAAPRRPRFLPEALGATQKVAGDLPRLPPALARTGDRYTVLARVCVSETGQVSSVSIERAAHPAIDAQVSSTVATWRYRPLLAASAPVPFCTFVRFEFRAL